VVLVVEVHILRQPEQETLHQHHHHKEILVERDMAPVDLQHMAAAVVVVPVQLELREHLVLVVQGVLDLKFLLQHHHHQHNQ
jgi:hypothetical protein